MKTIAAAEMKMCEQCKKEAAKYKCPGCSLRSCSLPCVRAHKERTSCSGKRDRTAFVPISSFDDTHLLSDYHLLEEMLRHSESARRFRAPFNTHRMEVNKGLELLRKQAQRRRIKLVFLPRGMTKRIENSTWYCRRRECIFWRIQWKFYSMDMDIVSVSADENKSPAEMLEQELSRKKTDGLHKVKMICKKPIDTMRFLLAKELCRGKRRKYVELDPSEPFGAQLDRLTIIEYPTILIVSPSDDTEFTIVDNRRLKLPVEVDPITQKLLASMVEAEGVPYKEEEIEEGEIVE